MLKTLTLNSKEMKNNEKKENKNLDLAKRFELDENAMNQIVGGTTFLMDGTFTNDTTVVSSEPDTFGCDIVLACDNCCKICTTNKGFTSIHICITKLKGR